MSVVELSDYRRHFSIFTDDGNAHIVPETLIQKWIKGEVEPDKDCVRKIIKEWYLSFEERSNV